MPNPVGSDAEGEYIAIFNNSAQSVNLDGWKLQDAGGKIFNLNGFRLEPEKSLKLDYRTTRLTLNNDGETIFLYDAQGKLADQLSFSGGVKEGTIIVKNNPELLENLPASPAGGPQVGGRIAVGDSFYQFWIFLILAGIILASLAVYAINQYDKTFIKK